MNWFENTEQKRKLLIGGLVVVCLAMLAVSARRNNVSFDSLWHLQAGLDWINLGLSPWQDHFSFTFLGEAVANPPYIFQALIAWMVNSLGFEGGFQLYLITNFFLVLGLVILFLRMLRAPALIYALVLPLIVVLIQFRVLVRPELISYSLCVVAVILYYRSKLVLSASVMLPILAFMLFWNNYHSSIFGYIIFFGFFVDVGIAQLRKRSPGSSWVKWFGWGIAIVAVGFINPEWSHPLLQLFKFSPEWKALIQEYQSPILYKDVAAVYSLLFIVIVTLPLLLWKRQFGLFVVCGVLVYFSAEMARLVTPSGIILLCIFAWVSSEIDLRSKVARLSGGQNIAAGGVFLMLVVVSIGSGLQMARDFMAENFTSGSLFPEDVVDHMLDSGITGRIFAEYQLGGYLVYRMAGDIQVYIDGRTAILYPVDHYKRYLLAKNSAEPLKAEIEKYDIDLVLLKSEPESFQLVQDTGLMGLDFVGAEFVLFRRENPQFPALGTLMAQPACWKPDLNLAVKNEFAAALWITPQTSVLLPLADLANRFANTDDPRAFLENLNEKDPWNDFSLRFAGFRALSEGMYEIAFDLFAGVKDKQLRDYLAAAWAKLRLGDMKAAEELLDEATRIPWPNSKQSELVILIGLLNDIKSVKQLELIEETYLERLLAEVEPAWQNLIYNNLIVQAFCSRD